MTDQERRQLEKLLRPENAIPFGSNPTAEVWPDTYTLVVGLGGVGIDALLETKGLVQRSCRESGRVKYLAIDADLESRFRRSSPDTGSVGLDREKGEWVLLNPPAAPFVIKGIPEYIRSWLDMSMAPLADMHGAGGVRQQGRLRLFCNIQQVMRAVQIALRSGYWSHTKKVRIFLMAGLGGGTGSGTFLDMAYIVRQLAEELEPKAPVEVYGCLFFPEMNAIVHPCHTAEYMKVNAYAALQELDWCMGLPEEGARFTQQYSETLRVDSDRPPFEQIYLFGMPIVIPWTAQKKVYWQNLRGAASAILHWTEEKWGDESVVSWDKYIAETRRTYLPPLPERKNHYSQLAEERLTLPRDQLLRCALVLQMEQKPESAPVVSKEETERFARMLGLCLPWLLPYWNWEDLPQVADAAELLELAQRQLERLQGQAENDTKRFLQNFEKQLKTRLTDCFVDRNWGPAWVREMLQGSDDRKAGLLEYINFMIFSAETELGRMKQMEPMLAEQVQQCRQELQHTPMMFMRSKRERFYNEVQKLFLCRTRQAAAEGVRFICRQCCQMMEQMNRHLFQRAGEILETMESLCTDCRKKYDEGAPDQLLTQVWNSRLGGVSLPEIETLRQAVLQAGEKVNGGEVDLKAMLDDYADRYLAPAADKPLEWYLQQAGHADLEQYVGQQLSGMLQRGIEKCQIWPGADQGQLCCMVSLPENCDPLYKAAMLYANGAGLPIFVRRTRLRDELRVQVVRFVLPLWSLPRLCDWETAAANAHEQGQYLWPQARELPSPIPLRARARGLEDCPPAIRSREEAARRLFEACRTAGMILEQNGPGSISYWLVTDWTKDDHVYAEESSAKCVKLCVIVESMDSEQRLVVVRECFAAIPRAISLARTALKEIESLEEC